MDGCADLADLGGDARQPDVVEEAGRVVDQRVVFVGAHEGLVLGRLDVVEAGGVRDVDAGDAVVAQPDGLRQAGPDIDHVRHDGVPVEILGGLDGRLEGLVVIVGDLLAGVAGVLGGELGDERPDRDHVRLLVAHGGDVAVEALLVELLGVHNRIHSRDGMQPGSGMLCFAFIPGRLVIGNPKLQIESAACTPFGRKG